MFSTDVSVSLLTNPGEIVELIYEFKANEKDLSFSMNEGKVNQYTIEEFIKEEKEN